MTLTDEQLDALAERLASTRPHKWDWRDIAREAARWAAEQQGEMVWEVFDPMFKQWVEVPTKAYADRAESIGKPVRAIRVMATTTKEGA